MSSKPATCVVALLLPDGTIDYRMHDDDIAGALSHPDTRIGVLVFYGYYARRYTVRPYTVRPYNEKDKTAPSSTAAWDLRVSRPPVFIYEEGAFSVKREITAYTIVPAYKYRITQQRATNILTDKRRIDWIVNEWMEKYV